MKTTKAYKDMTKQERREAAQVRAQAALDRIGDGVRSVWDSEAWRRWLTTLAKLHDYSLNNNTMLIAMQMPGATRVASYRSWQRDFGRHVKKGERGIEVLVPMVVKSKLGEDDETPQGDGETTERRRLVGFKVGHVFDVSQTEGEPLPEIASQVSAGVPDFDSLMGAIEAVSAYPIEVVDGLPPETNGLFSRRLGYIAVRRGMPEGQTVKTALHELAHSVMHDADAGELPDRAMREVQAESVAYAVSAALGLDTSGYSFGYVASWAVGKTEEEMRQCMKAVRDAAKQILDRIQLVTEA